MASSFMGLYVQRDGLQLAQKALDITGHNITNIQTEGYSRQRLDVCSVAFAGGTLGYNTGTELAGKGAEAIGVTQIRDKLIDAKVRKYSSELCDTGVKTTVLSDIEDILDDVENEDTGLAAIFGKWKSTFQSFSATSANRTDLANVCKNSAETVLNVLKSFETRIKDVEISTEKDIENTNERINTILKEMAQVNTQIEDTYVQMNDIIVQGDEFIAENQYGPLELKDKMNVLCDELAEYIDITVQEEPSGSYTVSLGDKVLVHKNKYVKTDIKFADDKADQVLDKNGDPVANVKYLEMDPAYDKDGQELEQPVAAGTELFFKTGEKSGVYADGNGGYQDENGTKLNAYVLGKSKFYDESGNEIDILGTVNDGSIVTDENGNTIKVKGNFDAECIEYNFTELYISSLNSEKGWKKAERELTRELENAGFGQDIIDINSLIQHGDVEEADRVEGELIARIEAYNAANPNAAVEYKPIFRHRLAAGEAPEYAIEYTEETDTMDDGSLKGLFDLYNGEGCYSGLNGNGYQGIKYYQETIRSMTVVLFNEFNGIYDDYNAANPDNQFKMFEFDGAYRPSNLRIADTWRENALRCVHPNGTEPGDYNYDELDNTYFNKILNVFDSKNDYGTEPQTYTFEEFISYYGNTVGGQLEEELSSFDATTTMYESVCEAREEVMGVSMDEEGVNMMNYQKWYNAISRMISAMDECLDKLINGTGRVGL